MKIERMRNIIAGTAGHIDHGKTALVRALTGIDTDRLEEEKRRGISIELGFAHLDLDKNIRLGFVDVPGHERFIKNMLAGVGGIDLVLFIIAADESVKPQTREHFDICRLLKIPKGIIVLTKADCVDPDILGLVRLEVEEFVRGSFLESAPIVAVSSITGLGLDELKQELVKMSETVRAKDSSRWFRMPIDRAFTMKGFGVVVTGTLVSGSVSVDQDVEVYPSRRRVRVRGVQVHGSAVDCALAGQRTALNLSGVDLVHLGRGMTLGEAGRFEPTQQIDAAFELLPGAKALKHGAPVHFHAGTAEVEADVRLLESMQAMKPGTRAYVRFLLREPLLLLPGDRFIARMFSPVVTIGGGEVIEIAAPRRMKRGDTVTRLRNLEGGERIPLLVRESKFGMGLAELISRTGLMPEEIGGPTVVARDPEPWFADEGWLVERAAAAKVAVGAFHRANPLSEGIPKEDLRARVVPGAPGFVFDAVLARAKDLVVAGELARSASHRVALKEDESAAVAKIERAFESAGLAVPSMTEVLAKSGVEAARARSLLQILLKNRALVKIGDDLVFHHTAMAKLKEEVRKRKGQRFAVPEFKEWTGISRKYAIPLLEFLDRERVTRRDGDSRVVL